MNKLNRSGFSLVEMMVVLTLIGILSLIAIPSYRSFQARARQKEGFNLLTTYYTAATATRAEFGHFPGNFVQTGFQPVGQLIYRFRAEDGTDINIGPNVNDNLCTRTFNACDCASAGGNCPEYKTWDEGPVAMGVGTIGIAGVVPTGCPSGDPNTTDDTFRAAIAARISASATRTDKYAINQNKIMEMCQDGLR